MKSQQSDLDARYEKALHKQQPILRWDYNRVLKTLLQSACETGELDKKNNQLIC